MYVHMCYGCFVHDVHTYVAGGLYTYVCTYVCTYVHHTHIHFNERMCSVMLNFFSVQNYRSPLLAVADSSHPILDDKSIRTIFYGVEELQELHSKLYKEFESRAQNWTSDVCVGDLFIELVCTYVCLYDCMLYVCTYMHTFRYVCMRRYTRGMHSLHVPVVRMYIHTYIP